MTENKDKPAFPVEMNCDIGVYTPKQTNVGYLTTGLTKRELIAAMALQGILSNH